ncbi:MAG: Histidine kinase, partial [uncultured Sulfurovum sp.]
KIKSLQESRNLFLRNIMHELKTPISKGKLITDLMDDAKNQERLQRIFSRFEYLLGEFTKIEQVTSNALVVNKNSFRVVDILDNSFDILLIESSDVDLEINANLEIDVDYELMSTAFKNLIDNALKYGIGRTKIRVEEDAIVFESNGEALENSSFEMAFNRAFEDSSKGLGLGLYITHHIVKRHGFTLNYTWIDGVNRFRIECRS